MDIGQKVNIHNRFDIEVRDATTGIIKKEATAYNIVLDSIWPLLCNSGRYFVGISFGSGTGTLSPERTTLFSPIAAKTAVADSKIKAFPTSAWKQKIVLRPEEFVGQTIREVGINSEGPYAGYLVTHALLKDSEGNPISITKTATDIITIYATIFATVIQDPTLIYSPVESNELINFLCGSQGMSAYGMVLSDMNIGDVNSISLTRTFDVNAKKINMTGRFGTTEGTGDIVGLGASNLFRFSLPRSGVFEGHSISGVSIGTGDANKRVFKLPSRNVRQSSIGIKNNGIVVSNYNKTIRNDLLVTGKPIIQSPSRINDITFSANGLVMAIGEDSGEYWYAYDLVGDTWIKRNPPAKLYGEVVALSLNFDGSSITIAQAYNNKVLRYDWVNGNWIRKNDSPSAGGYTYACALSDNGNIMVMAHQSEPCVTTFEWNGSAWIARPTPAVTPNVHGYSGDISGDGLIMAVGSMAAPWVHTYDWNGSAWIARPQPVVLPTNSVPRLRLNNAGTVLALKSYAAPFIHVYDWVGGVWVSRPTVPGDLSGVNSLDISEDGNMLLAGNGNSEFALIWTWIDGAWFKGSLMKGTFGANSATAVGISPAVNPKVVIGGQGWVREHFLKPSTFLQFDSPPGLGSALTSDYIVDGIHKTDQFVLDLSFSIQFGEGV